MRIVYLRVGRPPVVKDIDGSLESMQKLVGGYIQSVPLSYNTALVCDEDGRMKGRPVNRVAVTDDGDMIDLIRGDFFIAGTGSEDFVSLTDEQAARYIDMYLFEKGGEKCQ